MANKPEIGTLLKESLDQLVERAKAHVLVENRAKKAADKLNSSIPQMGKLIFAMDEKLADAIKTGAVPPNTPMSDYWQDKTGNKINNHAQSCAVVFRQLVQTGKVDEDSYDVRPAKALETTAAIITAVGGDVDHDAVKKASAILDNLSEKKVTTKLQNILNEVKPEKALNAEDALSECLRFCSHGLAFVLAEAIGKYGKQQSENARRELFDALEVASDKLATDEELERWADEKAAASAPVQIVTPETVGEAA